MLTYTVRRLLIMIPTLLVISFVTFIIIKLPPGDFLSNQIAELRSQGDKAALERVEFLRKQYGLDKPFLEQYAIWVGIWPDGTGLLRACCRATGAGPSSTTCRSARWSATGCCCRSS